MAHHFVYTCAYFTAARYMRTVERLADRVFAPTGLKPAYSYIMMTLEDHHRLTLMAIAKTLGYERSTVSRMVRVLAAHELVALTSAGRETVVELAPASQAFLVTANRCLTQFGQLTDQYLDDTKAPMTALLERNNDKLRKAMK